MINNNNSSLFLPSEETSSRPSDLLTSLTQLAGYPGSELSDSDVGAYCFSMSSGRVIFAMRLRELPDSYIVALPAILFGEDGKIIGRSLIAEPVIRLFKSTMLYSCRAPEGQRYFYYKFLLSRQSIFPELLTPMRVAIMETETSDMPDASKEAVSAVAQATTSIEDLDDDEADSTWKHLPYNKKTRH